MSAHKSEAGVTLIELLIVLIIVAILSVVIFISMSGSIDDARFSAAKDRAVNSSAALKKWTDAQRSSSPVLVNEKPSATVAEPFADSSILTLPAPGSGSGIEEGDTIPPKPRGTILDAGRAQVQRRLNAGQ